jgi:hypothetical protein
MRRVFWMLSFICNIWTTRWGKEGEVTTPTSPPPPLYILSSFVFLVASFTLGSPGASLQWLIYCFLTYGRRIRGSVAHPGYQIEALWSEAIIKITMMVTLETSPESLFAIATFCILYRILCCTQRCTNLKKYTVFHQKQNMWLMFRN